MKRVGTLGFAGGVAMLAVATLSSTVPAGAFGAIAVGDTGNINQDGFAWGRNVNSPDATTASNQALQLCRSVKDATDRARNACKIVGSFQGQCTALAMDPGAGTPGVGWAVAATIQAAQDQAMANCKATAGADRVQYCAQTDSACDGQK